MAFREKVFLKALIERPETARIMTRVFDPSWLEDAPLQPVFQEMQKFIQRTGVPPSVSTLREIFKKQDEAIYQNRMKDVLDELEAERPAASDMIYECEQARNVAVVRSFDQLVFSEHVRLLKEEHDAVSLMDELRKWQRGFDGDGDAVEMNLKEAIEHLIKERAFMAHESVWIRTGLCFIDEWCGGGLQRGECGLFIMPTGSGKSVLLTIIAHNIAKQLEKNVLLITNELTMKQEAERFLARITGENLKAVREDPMVAYNGLERHWTAGMHKHLRLIEHLKEFDTDWIEGTIAKYINLYGWKPDVIVIDFMERMRPTVTGVRRDQSWNWLKFVGQDIVRMAKRGNYVVWSAAQMNRMGYDAKAEPSLAHTQGGMMHLQEMDFIAIGRKVKNPDATSKMDLLQFACRKARSAKGDQNTIYVEADLGRMYITENIRSEITKGEVVDSPWGSNEGKTDRRAPSESERAKENEEA